MTGDYLNQKTRLRRTNDTIHLADCSRKGKKSVPWIFAEGMADDELRAEMSDAPWLHACKFCNPLGAVQ